MKRFRCCICGKTCYGFGNNPKPYKEKGRCCNNCDDLFVIPYRISLMTEKKRGND